MTSTPNLELVFFLQGEPRGDVKLNEASIRIDVALGCKVINQTQASEPGSPTIGDAYRIGTGSSLFTGRDGQIAYYYNGWNFIRPQPGFTFLDLTDLTKMYVFTVAPVTASSSGTVKSWTIT